MFRCFVVLNNRVLQKYGASLKVYIEKKILEFQIQSIFFRFFGIMYKCQWSKVQYVKIHRFLQYPVQYIINV